MSITLQRVRKDLKSYDDQLFLARRLTRLRSSGRTSADSQEPLGQNASVRRRMVERVAREVIDNLLAEGSGPVVGELKRLLRKEFDSDLHFGYGVLAQEMQVYKSTERGKVQLEKNETDNVLRRLWQLTVQTVDDTML